MTFTEGQASGMELFDSLDRKEREEEPMEMGALSETATSLNNALRGLTEAVRDMNKSQERLNTRVAKLEATKNSGRKDTTGNRRGKWTEEGRPICHYCDKAGHIQAECYQFKAAQKTVKKLEVTACGAACFYIYLKNGKQKIRSLIDTGAACCVMRKDVYFELCIKYNYSIKGSYKRLMERNFKH